MVYCVKIIVVNSGSGLVQRVVMGIYVYSDSGMGIKKTTKFTHICIGENGTTKWYSKMISCRHLHQPIILNRVSESEKNGDFKNCSTVSQRKE